ncbi:MAG: tyrosine-type recombinase/integrase, partial [Clostridia bacterium]|nr:tyrosine-type recombinase/integrase [Clostridia bacterium]
WAKNYNLKQVSKSFLYLRDRGIRGMSHLSSLAAQKAAERDEVLASIKKKVTLELGQKCRNKPSIVYAIDFPVTPHLLRHTYITNLIHAGVDPKTVQHLAGHKNSKVTMDIYAKVKYNKPEQLSAVVNEALEK